MRRLFFLAIMLTALAIPATAQLWNAARSSFAVKVAETVFDNSGNPWPFFNAVNAINYDQGGSGVAYNAASPQACSANGTAYRADCINFKTSTDGPSFQLGFNTPGTYYKYTINISQAGPYVINLRVAQAENNGTWTFLIDGTSVGTITAANTGSYSVFTVNQSPQFNATLGNHTLELLAGIVNGSGASGAGDISSFQGGAASNPATPAAVTAAGFSQLAINDDFTQPFYANKANWLDCGGAANPHWWQGYIGTEYASHAPCSFIEQTTDPNGTGGTVLHLHWDDSQAHWDGFNGQTIGTVIETFDVNGNNGKYFNFYYAEVWARLTHLCNPCFYNWWGVGHDPSKTELDGFEMASGLSDSDSQVINHPTGGYGAVWFGTPPPNIPNGFDPTQYHKWAWRLTSDGSSGSSFCAYIDDVRQGCTGYGANANQIQGGNDIATGIQIILDDRGTSCPGGQVTSTCGVITDAYFKSIKVWTCSAWSTSNPLAGCYSSSSAPSP